MKSNLFFKHDLYSVENDDCLRLVCSEYPVWGEAVFFRAITILYRRGGEPYNLKLLTSDVAHDLYTDNRDKVAEILALCLEVELFKLTEDGKLIYSTRVSEECKKQTDYIESQKKRVEKRWKSASEASESDTAVIPRQYHGNTTVIPTELPRNYHGNTNKQEQEQEQEYIPPYDNNKLLSTPPLKEEKPVKRFVKPSVEEVRAYCEERHNGVDAEKFVDYYETRNWIPSGSRTQMKDWKAAVRTWEKKNYNGFNSPNNKFSPPDNTNQYANLKFRKVTEL